LHITYITYGIRNADKLFSSDFFAHDINLSAVLQKGSNTYTVDNISY